MDNVDSHTIFIMAILFSPAIIAVLMLIFFRVKSHKKPAFYWITIIVLASIQTGCLSLGTQFGSIGRGGGTDNSASFLIILIIGIWLTLQIYYYKFKTRNNKP